MTTPSHPPDDDLPRDPAFDDAWRALSREEPSAALDAAVRAAARREVGAGPQVGAAHGDVRPRRSKPMNWWRPLAVAATLGALAVGLLQLVTPERIGAPGRDGSVVSDMPATSAARQAEAAKKQAAAASNEIAPPEEKAAGDVRARRVGAAAAPIARKRKRNRPRHLPSLRRLTTSSSKARARTRPPSASEMPDPRRRAGTRPARDAGGKAPRGTRRRARCERRAHARRRGGRFPHAKRRADAPRRATSCAPEGRAHPRAAEPFPAESAMRQATPTKREAASDAVAGRAPPRQVPLRPPPPRPPSDKAQAPKPAAENRAAPLAKLKTAPAQSTGDRGAAVTDSATLRREQDAQASTQGKSAMQAAAPAGTVDARVAEHPALAVPDWITLIRRLIAEKNYMAADKELAAFRTAHPDAQRLLPPDLRDWKAPRSNARQGGDRCFDSRVSARACESAPAAPHEARRRASTTGGRALRHVAARCAPRCVADGGSGGNA